MEDEAELDTGVISGGWSISISSGVTIAGNVTTYATGFPVAGVTMNVTGSSTLSGLTGPAGSYSLTVPSGGSYTVTPSKSGDTPLANGMSTFDLLLIRRHILAIPGAALDSPYKILAADANGSSSLSTFDILIFRQFILSNTSSIPAGLWRFVPASYVFPDPLTPWSAPSNTSYASLATDVSGQNYVAIKMGDVNNSWSPPALAAQAKRKADLDKTVVFRLSNVTAQPGANVKALLTVEGFAGVGAAQFTLQWDSAVLRYTGLGDYGLRGLSEGNFGTSLAESGKLTFAWDDPEGTGMTVADGTTVFSINFEVVGGPGSRSPLELADSPTPREVVIFPDLARFDSKDGSVQISGASSPVISSVSMDQATGNLRLSLPTLNGVTYVFEYADTLPRQQMDCLASDRRGRNSENSDRFRNYQSTTVL